MLITLPQWNKTKFGGKFSLHTLRGWARNGLISPAPVKAGRDWLVDDSASYVSSEKAQSIPEGVDMSVKVIDPVVLSILSKAA